MAYIQPNSIVKLLRNCPLDSGLRDTWWFSSKAAQTAYFEGLAMVTFTAQSYTRVTRNVIRVEYEADKLYSCNYMMFMNTAYNAVKWFYAFVDRIEYVNDHASNVYFTIDPIQTWFFEYSEKPCFIQRMHTVSDRLYANLEPEPVTISEYVSNGTEKLDNNLPVTVVIAQCDAEAGEHPRMFEKCFVGGKIIIAGYKATTNLNNEIENQLANNPNWVLDMHMALLPNGDPEVVTDNVTGGSTGPYKIGRPSDGEDGSFATTMALPTELRVTAGSTAISGYVPYNKKLYTYPFNFLNVFTVDGDSMTLRYEFFPTNIAPQFTQLGNVLQPACVRLFPDYYKNANGGAGNRCFSEQIGITGFPCCSWSSDAFASWFAQNSVPMMVKGVGALIGGAVSIATGNPGPVLITTSSLVNSAVEGSSVAKVDSVTRSMDNYGRDRLSSSSKSSSTSNIGNNNTNSKRTTVTERQYSNQGAELANRAAQIGINSITEAFTGGYQASLAQNLVHGSYQNGSNTFACGTYHFYATRCSITGQQAQRIDKYFDAFGYAMNDIYTPERRVRQKYTYIQTRNCLVDGDIPADDRSLIEKCYDEGIRFWVNGAVEMGAYDIAGNGVL